MKRAYFKYILALLLFGSNGIVASRIALSSYEIVFWRTLIGSLLLVGLFFLSGQKPLFTRERRDALFVILSGAAMGASWMFLYEAYDRIGVSLASLLYYCGPVIVMALSPLLFKERLSAARLIGFAAVFCGIFLVNGVLSGERIEPFGLFCGLMSALMYSLMVILNKKSAKIQGLENSALQLLTSFLTVAVFVGFKTGFRISLSGADMVWMLQLGLVNTGIGCYLYFSSIGSLPVQSVSVCGYLEPLSAVILAALILGENLQSLQTLGAALILGGAFFSECCKIKRWAVEIFFPQIY